MTNDYKEKLLKYFTNNLDITSGSNMPSFLPMESYTSTLKQELDTQFPNGYEQVGYCLCKNSSNELNGYVLVYGNYYKTSTQTIDNMAGYIVLLNSEYELVQIITEFDSGTELSYLLYLDVDETGKTYGLDYSSNKVRFILLNNISLKTPQQTDYYVKLRNSYFCQGNIANAENTAYKYMIIKSPLGAKYFLMAVEQTRDTYCTLLSINVGQANEWIDYTFNRPTYSSGNIATYNLLNTKIRFNPNDENIDIQIYEQIQVYNTTTQTYEDTLELYMNDNNQYVIESSRFYMLAALVFPDLQNKTGFIIGAESGSMVSLSGYSDDYLSIACSYQANGEYKNVIRIMKNIETQIYSRTTDATVSPVSYTSMKLINNTAIMTSKENIYYSSTAGTMNLNTAHLITSNDGVVAQPMGISLGRNDLEISLFIPTNMYNLFMFNIVCEDLEEGFIKKIVKIVYNPNNYNGDPYEEHRVLLPQQAFIYNNNNKLVFARNLYNKVINHNTTEATVEIPNTMLNDIQLGEQSLIGYTNYELVENAETIEKNIYENLYINFFNTLMIQNRNNPNNVINNLNGAVRLNNSISNLCDYENATISKYKINYNDGSNEIKNVRRCTITNNIATFEIAVMVSKLIDTIDLISGDEATIYQTIDCSNMEVSKMYSIKQDCYVE